MWLPTFHFIASTFLKTKTLSFSTWFALVFLLGTTAKPHMYTLWLPSHVSRFSVSSLYSTAGLWFSMSSAPVTKVKKYAAFPVFPIFVLQGNRNVVTQLTNTYFITLYYVVSVPNYKRELYSEGSICVEVNSTRGDCLPLGGTPRCYQRRVVQQPTTDNVSFSINIDSK